MNSEAVWMCDLTAWDLLKYKLRRVRMGMDTPAEFFLICADKFLRFLKIPTQIKRNFLVRKFCGKYCSQFREDGYYHFKDARLPLLDEVAERDFFDLVFEGVYLSYLEFSDRYDEELVDRFTAVLPEGFCCLKSKEVNVTVASNDIVIDAGSWIGDFAAYASAKGATVYAFEPAKSMYAYLTKTAKLNPRIHPVNKGLGDTVAFMKVLDSGYTLGNAIAESGDDIELTSIDTFVHEQGLSRVDFIKADIEGYERKMLKGAWETLRQFAPKLSICTYHLKDDPEVLASLIKEANPKYKIIQKRMKLYASI